MQDLTIYSKIHICSSEVFPKSIKASLINETSLISWLVSDIPCNLLLNRKTEPAVMRILPSPYVPRHARRFHWPHQSCRSGCSLPGGLAHPTCCWGLLMFLSVPVFCYCTQAFLQVFQHLLSAGPWECHCLYSVSVSTRAWVSVWQNKCSVLQQHFYFKDATLCITRTCINSCFVTGFQSLHKSRIQLWNNPGTSQ